jgi:hypothetical protein
MSTPAKQAEQLYTLADLARLLKVPAERLRALQESKEMRGPDVLVPGGGHKGARWTASRVTEIQKGWPFPSSV